MQIIRFTPYEDPSPRAGLLEGDTIHELAGDIFPPFEKTGRTWALDRADLAAPCRPGKVVAIGLNYRDHAEEFKLELPQEPIMFIKPASSVIGPGEKIVCPGMSRRVDYEAELAVVMGRRTRSVKKAEALDHVLGYTCLNDVTARDLQGKDGQWTRAKSFDTFCPIGPAIVTGLDPADLSVEAWLNGERKQGSRTSNLVFDVAALIEFVSAVMTLEPGDVIATGTPSGVGRMVPGDRIEVRIEGVGSLVNPVGPE
ncbi:MAG: fumarylacetoacetate hydrolase family protein [Proteobacteria bacterium]|nr:fumarylacetoacetate hydrolase family protein [Pseudomonadota bacterium]